MGADRKVNTWELFRAPSGRLQRLQRRVALEALSEFGSSFGTKVVALQTASMGEAGAERCQPLTHKSLQPVHGLRSWNTLQLDNLGIRAQCHEDCRQVAAEHA